MDRRVVVLLLAGVMVGVSRLIFPRLTSHAGDVAAAIWFRSGEMPFWRTVSSAVISILAVAFGAAVGRESAPKQVGAAVGSLLAGWAKLSSTQRRLVVACGTGAGMAAVYNVPLGGALFALEVLLGQVSLPLVLPALATTLIAVAVSWLFLPNQPTYFVPAYPFSPVALAGGAVLGLLAGLVSVIYVKAIAWADTRKPKGKWIVLAPVLVFAALGVASIYYPQLLGNGKDVVQLAFLDQISLPLLAILLIPRALATVSCLAAGTPGGLFTPIMTVGALLGSLFGHLWNQIFPGQATAAYAIFGAGAVLAATAKGPLSALVLVFELTSHVLLLAVPLMLAIAVATLVARYFDARSIYSVRIHSGKSAAARLNHDRVISSALPYAEVLQRLLSLTEKNRPLYVVDENGQLAGQITVERAAQAENFARPLQTASADDLATAVKTLPASISPEAMEHELATEQLDEMPVIDSGRFAGIFRGRGLK
jgi:H+/Cl- antiporter ClcA